MARMSDNFYQRQCLLANAQVPAQSTMLKNMQPPLAKVYFDSMNHKLKVLAGLEPPMKGGGSDWFVPPKELLAVRTVLQPVKKESLNLLGFDGIAKFGEMIAEKTRKQMQEEKERVLADNDCIWKTNIQLSTLEARDSARAKEAAENSAAIRKAFWDFSNLYSTSMTKIETVLVEAAVKDIQIMEEETFQKMKHLYTEKLDKQAKFLYDKYTNKLNNEKERLKTNFIEQVYKVHSVMAKQIHQINMDKHIAIEKLRQLLESVNLACQVYVALKERDECQKETQLSQHEQKKVVKRLQETIAMKDLEIRVAQEKIKKRAEFNAIWKKKICEVVKKFQFFVKYCLKTIPEQADFFIDMEKLMMLQLNEARENPSVSSIFVPDPEFHTPIPKPHPYYLCCDRGYTARVDQNFCPKHCTSSASQLPVVIVNKRCIYAACDNFQKFHDKVTEYVHGRRGDDVDFEDNHNYEYNFPFKMTSSQQLLELKLESSLMQVLQKELPNVNRVRTECCICKIPYCFCSPSGISPMSSTGQKTPNVSKTSLESLPTANYKIETRSVELMHEREPKWESYMQYVVPTRCKCGKTAKKHLEEHLPSYMKNMSIFEEPQLPGYEKCSIATLKKLVRIAHGKRPPPPPADVEPRTRDIGTQYSDEEFEVLCKCLSTEEIKRIFSAIVPKSENNLEAFNETGDGCCADLVKRPSTFAMECAQNLKQLLDGSSELEEIFKRTDCYNF